MRIVFGSIITEGHGKVGGQIIQASYGGYQLRNIVQPVNPQVFLTQFSRAYLRRLSSEWRNLSGGQQSTWIGAAGPGQSGFEKFMTVNLPLFRAQSLFLESYVAPVTPIVVSAPFDQVYSPAPGSYAFLYNPADPDPLTANWIPYARWTGWIRQSLYSFPPLNRSLVTSDVDWTGGFFQIFFEPGVTLNPLPQFDYDKCKVELSVMNVLTGQIQTLQTDEISAGVLT
ncbi:MAG TPA: hypothetical protein VGO47_05350 [Chlamydiales bacterium]|nr:hypothetical protein [Chlamydiales bacterium]